MSFNIALSGIAASQTDLDTTANNIANVATVGFKESRAEFESVYANSLFSNSKTQVGDGVSVAAVAQQFSQGSLKFTDNPLDMAITGSGFFATTSGLDDNNLSYTRNGTFKLNSENFIVDNSGNYLQAFPVNEDGSTSSVSLSTTEPIQIPETAGIPQATEGVGISLNLPALDDAKSLADFDAANPDTYNNATSVTIYDSLGGAHILNTYYVKPDNATNKNAAGDVISQWVVFTNVDGVPVNPTSGNNLVTGIDAVTNLDQTVVPEDVTGAYKGVVLTFDDSGVLDNNNAGTVAFNYEKLGAGGAGVLSGGANEEQQFSITFNNPTQFASSFEVTGLEQDGVTVGRLTGVEIGSDGLVEASYSNGTSSPLARVAIVRFSNEQGLTQTGSSWIASQSSGDPLAGEAGSGSFGSISSGALEQSNVDLTTELVDLITAQRNFQANSRSLEVNSELQQTILQIK